MRKQILDTKYGLRIITLLFAILHSFFINLYFGFKKVLFIGRGILFIKKGHIKIGKNTTIFGRYRIESHGEGFISIGKNCGIAENLHLTCGNKVIIGDFVGIANNVTITDINHPFSINNPISTNKLNIHIKGTSIGYGSFIGCNSYISPGVQIGKNVFIGANSVVLSSIPDNSIAVGSPCKVIKTI